ncbi:MAG: hypothetical protein M1827_006975 [Pycnora praestabilis]|nr:MAG: hypothetical protein M1827_006975 [Pycnora praestabilis]
MSTPVNEIPQPRHSSNNNTSRSSDEEGTYVDEGSSANFGDHLAVKTSYELDDDRRSLISPSQTREQDRRLDDDLAMLQVEREVSNAQTSQNGLGLSRSKSLHQSRSRVSDRVDEFDVATNPLRQTTAVYKLPEHPTTHFAKVVKKIHNSSFLIRYFTYIVPVVGLLLIPLLLGALVFTKANVGGVKLLWFSIWLEVVWLTLWGSRIVAKCLPVPMGLISSTFTNNSKKWRDMGKQLEVPATVFFWLLSVEISFLPTMKNHHTNGNKATKPWETTMNKILVSIFVGGILNFAEKIIIQLIAISFHLRTYADRIELNKFQIGSLTKLYQYSKEKIAMEDSDFEEGGPSGPGSGARTPMQYIEKAHKNAREAFSKVGDVAGKVAGDFTGHQVAKSTHPHQVILMLLNSTSGSQILARRLYRTFAREDTELIYGDDLKNAFDNDEEADAAFTMFDKDLNGDISMEELESVCVEIGRERKSITASLKDLDSVVSKLDDVLFFFVAVVTILVFISLISTSAAGVLTSAGSSVLALSWLFSATAQEFLQSVVFVFVKHPFDVGDRVTIYGNQGIVGKGDDYFVKEIALFYTEFKKMEGHIVQAPNSYLNTLFILNMRRSGGVAEAVPITIKFGTTLDQINSLRERLLEFVKAEKREYQGNILTELRDVVEAHALNLNVVFFFKSNWQNEGLRLQRRNKFICALMVSMQELGIEGPRMRYPGTKEDLPVYLHNNTPTPHSQVPATGLGSGTGPGPKSGFLSRDPPFIPSAADGPPVRQHPSILRNDTVTSRTSRARGESVSAMAKRVDFSLGMRGMVSGDMMADVYEDRSRSRVPNYSPSPSRGPDTNTSSAEDNRSLARTTSHEPTVGLVRTSSDSQARLRSSHSTHRNRFFGRHRGDDRHEQGEDTDLMEQGMANIPENDLSLGHLDPRSSLISPQAIRTNANTSSVLRAPGGLPVAEKFGTPQRSHTEDFEMRRLNN